MKVTVAATQMACSWDREANIANAERLIREAAKQGANVILIQELFEAPYFCKDHLAKHFELALPIAENPAIQRLSRVAKELSVVLPLSVFERAQNAYFNTLVMVDADGKTLGIYRKAHIPESPGYHEKFYFSPGDTGFKVWPTRFGKLGVAVWQCDGREVPCVAGSQSGRWRNGGHREDRAWSIHRAWRRSAPESLGPAPSPVTAATNGVSEPAAAWTAKPRVAPDMQR